MVVEGKIHPCITKMWIVKGIEGVKTISIYFCSTVASQQSAAEVNTHFGNACMSIFVFQRSQLDTSYQILRAVSTKLSDGQLRASEDNGFRKIFKHKR